MNWHIVRASVESYLHKQSHVVEKFYAKPKVFGSSFVRVQGLNIKYEFVAMLSLLMSFCLHNFFMTSLHIHNNSNKLTVIYVFIMVNL